MGTLGATLPGRGRESALTARLFPKKRQNVEGVAGQMMAALVMLQPGSGFAREGKTPPHPRRRAEGASGLC